MDRDDGDALRPDDDRDRSTRRDLARRDQSLLPRNGLVSIEAVQEYVAVERKRVRRILFGISSLFLVVVLIIFAVFLAIGIYVLNNTKAAQDHVRVFRAGVAQRLESIGAEMQSLASDAQSASQQSKRASEGLNAIQEQSREEKDTLHGDLERFSGWVASQDQRLKSRLKESEARQAALVSALGDMQRKYDALLVELHPQTVERDGGSGAMPAPGENMPPATPSAAERAALAPLFPPEGTDDAIFRADPPRTRDVLSGSRRLTVANGDSYEGGTSNDLFQGTGTYVYARGDLQSYKGEFVAGKKEGRGTLLYRNGARYDGEFHDDVEAGQGVFFFENGDKYEGTFLGGRKHGDGVYTYVNGDVFTGQFRDGEMSGEGALAFANGDRYRGEFRHGMREGQGVYEYVQGGKYSGEFKAGRRHGSGRYVYPSGGEFEGHFENGLKNGEGTYTYQDGTKLSGTWANDQLAGAR